METVLLTACGCEDYEAGPVVFDQLAHAAARRSKVDRRGLQQLGRWYAWEPGSAMSVVVIHALPLVYV